MPKRAMRCTVDVNIHAITCPGVWLPHRDDVYVSMRLFNQVRQTQLSSPIFPLIFHERFRFDKVFYTAFEPSQVAENLEYSTVLIELIQLSDILDGGRLLAHYECNARDFLYPYPAYSPSYGTQDREVLMLRSLDFPGIAPKLEFSTRTTLNEIDVPLYSSDDDLLGLSTTRASRPRSRTRSRTPWRKLGFSRPTVSSIKRSRSLSPSLYQRLDALDLQDSYIDESRPPFVVRKVDKNLIGRTPGSGEGRECLHGSRIRPLSSGSQSSLRHHAKRRRKSKKGKTKGRDSGYCSYCKEPFTERNCTVCQIYRRYTGKKYWGHSWLNHPTGHRHSHIKVVREAGSSPYPLYKYGYYSDPDSDDLEVAQLTSPDYGIYARPRTTSPLLYRSSLSDRYDERPWSPAKSELISSRVERALRRNRSLERLDRVSTSPYTSHSSLYHDYEASLSELAHDLERAKSGSTIGAATISKRLKQAAYFSQSTPWRDTFNHSLSEIYSEIYQQLLNS